MGTIDWRLAVIAFLAIATHAAAQVVGTEQPSGIDIAKILGAVVAAQVALRAIAEALTRLAVYTDNTWDNKIAAALSEVSWFTGALLGKFGYGTPSPIVTEIKSQGIAEEGANTTAERPK